MIRFIHLADVHLGAVPDRGCPWSREREEEIWETFRRVIATIRKSPVDLLFIAGDLFHRQPLLSELREILSTGHSNGIRMCHFLTERAIPVLRFRRKTSMYMV